MLPIMKNGVRLSMQIFVATMVGLCAYISHSPHSYVVGRVHIQNIENFWSIFKRGIYGVYRHCDPRYLQNYANEYAFRYSNRKSDVPMFELVLANASR